MNENDLKELGLLSDEDIKALAAESDAAKKAALQKEALKKGVDMVKKSHLEREKEALRKELEKTIQDGTHKGTQKHLTSTFKSLLTEDEIKALDGKQTKEYIDFLNGKLDKHITAKIEDFKKTLPTDAQEIAGKYKTLADEYEALKQKAGGFDAELSTKLAEQEKALRENFALETCLNDAIANVMPYVLDGFSRAEIAALFAAKASLKSDNGKIVVVDKAGKLIAKDERSNFGEDVKGYLMHTLQHIIKKSNGTTPNNAPTAQNGVRPIAPKIPSIQ